MNVLFEPTVTSPVIVPLIWMTAAVVPLAAALSALSEDTIVGVAFPPPVVLPL